MPETSATPQTNHTTAPAIFTTYWVFHIAPEYHSLSAKHQEQAREEFLAALDARDPSVTVRGVYSLVGLRHNADLMFWLISPDLDAIQRLGVALRHTTPGQYLRPVETYIGMNTPARYDPEHMPAFLLGAPPKKFVSLYPFVKTADWYLLPFEERREVMAEHGQVGRRYAVPRAQVVAMAAAAGATPITGSPTGNGAHGEHGPHGNGHSAGTSSNGNGAAKAAKVASKSATATKTAPVSAPAATEEGGGVLSSTVDSFGLGDYEFILANESDDPAELVRMMHSLRATEARRYTKLDVPIYLCRLRTPAEALEDL